MKKKYLLSLLLIILSASASAQNATVVPQSFDIVRVGCVDTAKESEENSKESLFPHRRPDKNSVATSSTTNPSQQNIGKNDIKGVYNDTLQTLTLTFNFTSSDTRVTIYKNFNKMLQETISVGQGTTLVYNISDYGTGSFIVDVRDTGGYQFIYFSSFMPDHDSLHDATPTFDPYLKSQTIQETSSQSQLSPQYSFNAKLTAPLCSFCKHIKFSNSGNVPVSVSYADNDINLYIVDPANPSQSPLSEKFYRTLPNSQQTDEKWIHVEADKEYILIATLQEEISGSSFCSVHVGSFSYYNQRVAYDFLPLPINKDMALEYNIFATDNVRDIELFVLKGSNPGEIIAYNDNYGQTEDYNWATNPRVKQVFNTAVSGVIVGKKQSRLDAMVGSDTGTNVYVGCLSTNNNLRIIFRDSINTENIMISAPANKDYKSFNWAVGEWIGTDDPNSAFSDAFDNADLEINSMDAFFSSKGYIRTSQAGSNDAVIDVYGQNGKMLHAAARSYYTPTALGFSWESKLGAKERVFHPRTALGNRYGSLLCSYKEKSIMEYAQEDSYETRMLDYVFENASLTDDEIDILIDSLYYIDFSDMDAFDDYFVAADRVLQRSAVSDFSEVEQDENYQQLINLCNLEPRLLYYAFYMADQGELLAVKIIEDLIDVPNHPAMLAMKAQKQNRMYIGAGANKKKLRHTMQTNAVLFIQQFLALQQNQELLAPGNISYSNDENIFNATANNYSINLSFNLPEAANVSLLVTTPYGELINQPLSCQKLDGGAYRYSVPVTSSGVYITTISINGRIYNKKLSIK